MDYDAVLLVTVWLIVTKSDNEAWSIVVSACLRLRGGDLGSERRRQPRPASPGSVRQWANIRHQSSVPTRDAGMGIEWRHRAVPVASQEHEERFPRQQLRNETPNTSNNLVKLLSLHSYLAFKLTKSNTADNRVKFVHPRYKGFFKSLCNVSYKGACACWKDFCPTSWIMSSNWSPHVYINMLNLGNAWDVWQLTMPYASCVT